MSKFFLFLKSFKTRPSKKILFFGGGLFCLALFFKLTLLLYDGKLEWLDRELLKWVELLRRPGLNGSASDITELGSLGVVIVFMVIAGVMLLTLKNYFGAVFLILSTAGAAWISPILKDLIARDRPEVISKLVQTGTYSYPSGHSIGAAAFYLSLGVIFAAYSPSKWGKRIWMVCMLILILLVGLSRLYLGVHYPSDVLAGILVGFAWALLLAGLYNYFPKRP